MSNKDKAIATAKPYFEGASKHEELHVTSDGQVFTSEDYAYNHAKTLGTKLETVSKEDVYGKQVNAEPSILDAGVKNLPEALDAITDVAELEALIEEEKGKTSRKGAFAAIEARIVAINDASAELSNQDAAKDINVDLGTAEGDTKGEAGAEGSGE